MNAVLSASAKGVSHAYMANALVASTDGVAPWKIIEGLPKIVRSNVRSLSKSLGIRFTSIDEVLDYRTKHQADGLEILRSAKFAALEREWRQWPGDKP